MGVSPTDLVKGWWEVNIFMEPRKALYLYFPFRVCSIFISSANTCWFTKLPCMRSLSANWVFFRYNEHHYFEKTKHHGLCPFYFSVPAPVEHQICPAVCVLMKLSFDEEHRHAMNELGKIKMFLNAIEESWQFFVIVELVYKATNFYYHMLPPCSKWLWFPEKTMS